MKYIIILIVAMALTSCGEQKRESKLGAPATPVAQTPLEASVTRGKAIYADNCVTCHMTNGKGVPGAFPPLNPSDWLTNKRIESIHAVKYGLKGLIEVNGQPYDNIMLSLGLDDQEIADVMNYTIQNWNSGEMVTVEEVKAIEK